MEATIGELGKWLWVLAVGVLTYDNKTKNDRLRKVEQDMVPKSEVKELIREEMKHVHQDMGRIDGKLDQITSNVEELNLSFKTWQARLDERDRLKGEE